MIKIVDNRKKNNGINDMLIPGNSVLEITNKSTNLTCIAIIGQSKDGMSAIFILDSFDSYSVSRFARHEFPTKKTYLLSELGLLYSELGMLNYDVKILNANIIVEIN